MSSNYGKRMFVIHINEIYVFGDYELVALVQNLPKVEY